MWGKKFLISYRVSFPVSIEIFKAVDLKDLFRDLEIVQDPLQERLIETDKIERDIIIREGSQYACSKTLKEFTSKSQQFETF